MRHVILENSKTSNLNKDWGFKPSPYNPEYLELDSWPKKLSAQEAKEYLFLNLDIEFGVMDTDSSIVEKVFSKPPQTIQGPVSNIDDLKPGMTLYKVNKNIDRVEAIKITSFPYRSDLIDSLFIDYGYYHNFNNSIIEDRLSLLDYNVIPNSYNDHRLFHNLQEALEYFNK